MPIAKPDPVRASTSSGSAVKLTASPSAEIPWLDQEDLEVAVLGERDVDRLDERLGGRLCGHRPMVLRVVGRRRTAARGHDRGRRSA